VLRKLLIPGVAALVLAAVAAVAWAQAPPPVVNVTLGRTTIAVQGPTATPNAGPTRFVFSSTGGPRLGFLFALEPGRTVDELRAALASGRISRIERLGTFETEVSLSGREETRAVTLTLKPGTTYVAIDGSRGDRRTSQWPLFAFPVAAQPNGATAPAPDARVRFVDFGFRGDTRLPRNGTIRFENDGDEPHFAVAVPIRPGTSRAARRALRTDGNFERYVAGRPVSAQGLISPGVVNDVEFRFPRRGTYLLVCFFGRHHELGMYRTVRVR
jgi:hypothetical protein